jgi:hypothetical protein
MAATLNGAAVAVADQAQQVARVELGVVQYLALAAVVAVRD